MRQKLLLAFCVLFVGLLAGCESIDNSRSVVGTTITFKDGQSISWKLSPGHYELEMTATNDGARVEWTGASCGQANGVKTFFVKCEMDRTGQLVISNPSTSGSGADTTVKVKLLKLPN